MPGDVESRLPPRSFGGVVVESVLIVTLNILTVAGNSLVLLAVYRNPRLRSKVYHVYVASLAFSDLFLGILSFPIVAAVLITGRLPGGETMCWFVATTTFYPGLVSIYTMVVISIQRYYKVVKPDKHDSMFSRRRVAASVCLIWFAAAAVILLLALTSREVSFLEKFPNCAFDIHIIIIFTVFIPVSVALPYATMLFFYLKIWTFVKTHNLHIGNSNVNAEEVKVNKLLCFVLGAFAVSYVPYVLFTACELLGKSVSREAAFAVQVLGGLSSIVNPLIYAVMNREFRTEFSKITCFCLKRAGNSAEIQPARN